MYSFKKSYFWILILTLSLNSYFLNGLELRVLGRPKQTEPVATNSDIPFTAISYEFEVNYNQYFSFCIKQDSTFENEDIVVLIESNTEDGEPQQYKIESESANYTQVDTTPMSYKFCSILPDGKVFFTISNKISRPSIKLIITSQHSGPGECNQYVQALNDEHLLDDYSFGSNDFTANVNPADIPNDVPDKDDVPIVVDSKSTDNDEESKESESASSGSEPKHSPKKPKSKSTPASSSTNEDPKDAKNGGMTAGNFDTDGSASANKTSSSSDATHSHMYNLAYIFATIFALLVIM